MISPLLCIYPSFWCLSQCQLPKHPVCMYVCMCILHFSAVPNINDQNTLYVCMYVCMCILHFGAFPNANDQNTLYVCMYVCMCILHFSAVPNINDQKTLYLCMYVFIISVPFPMSMTKPPFIQVYMYVCMVVYICI